VGCKVKKMVSYVKCYA